MKRILKIFYWVVGLLVVIYLALYFYILAHKKEIIAIATEKTESYLSGNVSIGGVELSFLETFPDISVKFTDVTITDSLYPVHQQSFFKAGKVFLKADLSRLLQTKLQVKGINISNAHVTVFTDSAGYSNDYLFKSKSFAGNETTNEHFGIRSITVKNTVLSIIDKIRKQNISVDIKTLQTKVRENAAELVLAVHSNVLIRELSFRFSGDDFLKNKKFRSDFNLLYDKKTNVMKADSVDLDIEGTPLNVSFSVDWNGTAPKFHSKINSGKIFIF